MQTSIQM